MNVEYRNRRTPKNLQRENVKNIIEPQIRTNQA